MKLNKELLYLVTGGTGFLGTTLVTKLVNLGLRVKVVSRNEGKLFELQHQNPGIEILPGDISDKFTLRQAVEGVGSVFHLAAFKHVGMAQTQCVECIDSNIIGSKNLYEMSLNEKWEFIISISTDKAAQIVGVYGASKYLMEQMCHQYAKYNTETKYRMVRYGNVLYSTGSVLIKWKDLLSKGEEIIITEPEATRFFWTVEEAIDLIFECLENATDSKPYFPAMKSIKIGDLLQAMAGKYLPEDKELRIKKIGLQPGENMHEKIIEDGPNSNEVENFTIDEIKELI